MTDQVEEHPSVRKLAGALALAASEPVSMRTLRAATNRALRTLYVLEHGSAEQHETALTLCRYASALSAARYLGHYLPDAASIDITIHDVEDDDDADACFDAVAYDLHGATIALTQAERDAAVEIVIDRLFQSHMLLMPDIDETLNIDLHGLRADHPEHDDDIDEILGLDQIPEPPAEELVALAHSDGGAALTLIYQSLTTGTPALIDDSILHLASAETVRRYEADGDYTHLQFGAMINAFIFARAIWAALPQIDTVAFSVDVDGSLDLDLLDCEGDPLVGLDFVSRGVDPNLDLDATVDQCTRLLFPNPAFRDYLAALGARFLIPIADSVKRLPAPGA